MYIGLLDHNPVYKAKMGAINRRNARRRKRLAPIGWQIRVNRMIARNAHDKRTVKPSTTHFKPNMAGQRAAMMPARTTVRR